MHHVTPCREPGWRRAKLWAGIKKWSAIANPHCNSAEVLIARTCARSLTKHCILDNIRCIRVGWLSLPVGLLLALIAAPFIAMHEMASKHCSELCYSMVLCSILTCGFPLALFLVFSKWEPVESLGL